MIELLLEDAVLELERSLNNCLANICSISVLSTLYRRGKEFTPVMGDSNDVTE